MPTLRIPTLETERLVLRPMTMQDWPAYEVLMASERAVYMGGPHAQQAAWGMFCHDAVQWQLFGHGALMLEEKTSSACLGQVGINHGPLFPERELGWFLYGDAEGRGYAREAAEAMRDWAFDSQGLCSLVSYVDPENHRSRRLAETLGGTVDPSAPRKDPRDVVYRYGR